MDNGLLECLREAGCPDLPPAIGEGYRKKWIKGIIRALRGNGDIAFCLAVNDGHGQPRITRDFCPSAIIAKVLSVHPYEETSANIVPRFANDEQRVKYLRKMGYDEVDVVKLLSVDDKTPEQIEADRAKINGYIEEVAMRQAKIMSDINEDARKRIEIADPELKEKKAKRKAYGKTATRKTAKSKG